MIDILKLKESDKGRYVDYTAQERLQAQGYIALSPACLPSDGFTYAAKRGDPRYHIGKNTIRRKAMQLKLNNIYMMDCLEGIRSVPSKSIKSIITDPPYFMGMTHNGQKGNFIDLQICKPFYSMLAQEFARVLKDTGEFYIFTDWRGYAFYYPIFAEYLPIKNMLVWDKLSGAGNFYAYTHELIIYGCLDPQTNKKGVNIWREKGFNSGARMTDGEKVHPTQKPVALIQRAIEDSTRGGDTVLDAFMGSGTTAVAALRTGRNYIGFEISEKNFIIAQNRVAAEKVIIAGGVVHE